MGAGKTTAIQSLSETRVVRTEALNSDHSVVDKLTTTVALDYGEIGIGPDEKVRLYGIPGQRRFNFMWRILKQRAVGMVLLVNNDAHDPLAYMLDFLDDFSDLYARGGVVVAVTRRDIAADPPLAAFSDALVKAHPGMLVPVFDVDARSAADMKMALMSLVLNIEMRATYGAREAQSA